MITSVKVRTCHIASMSVSVTVRVCSSAYGSCCYILVLQFLNYELTSTAINTYQSVKYVVLIYVFILSIIYAEWTVPVLWLGQALPFGNFALLDVITLFIPSLVSAGVG